MIKNKTLALLVRAYRQDPETWTWDRLRCLLAAGAFSFRTQRKGA